MLKAFFDKNLLEAGCDEAGRGCLAGPVFAAAVIFNKKYRNKWLNDSKKLSDKIRYELRPEIEANSISWAIGIVDQHEIDEINILNASFLAMHRAIDKLKTRPELLLIDGNRFKPYKKIHHQCIIKGDDTYMSIAAASILAKTYKDKYIQDLVAEYPDLNKYDLLNNSGYGTQNHIDAIKMYGITEYHRKTFGIYRSFF